MENSPAYTRTRSRNTPIYTKFVNQSVMPYSMAMHFWIINLWNGYSEIRVDYLRITTDTPREVPDAVGKLLLTFVSGSQWWVPVRPILLEFMKSYAPTSDNVPEDFGEDIIQKIDDALITDTVTPNYRTRINSGEIINNPCSNKKTRINCDHHIAETQGGVPSFVYTNNQYASLTLEADDVSYILPQYLKDETIASFINDCKIGLPALTKNISENAVSDAFSKVNGGTYEYLVELLEGKETIEYLILNGQRLIKIAKSIKSGKFKRYAPKVYKKFKRLLKQKPERRVEILFDLFGSAWMEARYAIRPILYSITDGLKLYDEGIKAAPERMTVNGYRSEVVEEVHTRSETLSDGSVLDWYTVFSRHARSYAGVLLQPDLDVHTLRTLGFTNLVTAGVEIIPLSFVAGFFVNFSGAMYNLTPNIGIEVLTSWNSVSDIYVAQGAVTRKKDGVFIESISYELDCKDYNRVPIVDGPSSFNLDLNLSVAKLLDITAILRGFTKYHGN